MHHSIYRIIWATLALIILAQVAFAPVLLSVVFASGLLCLIVQTRQSKAQKASTLIKLVFMLCALVVIYFNYRTFLGVDAGVAFLTACLFAKALETRSHRDAIILFNFALFVSASLFLYSQALWMAVLVLCALIACFLGLYRLQITQFEHGISQRSIFKHDLKQVLKVLALSTPFLVLLFMFFPRLPPLWHIPLPEKRATTGMSDRMSPGDIAELSQSAELAFRILGNVKQLPPRAELYWRGMALDHYDGQTWTSSVWSQKANEHINVQNSAKKWNYQYLAMDQSVPWVMGLEYSIPTERRFYVRQDGGVMPYRLQQRSQPISMQWVGQTSIETAVDDRQTHFLQQLNTQFKQTSDPRAQALALQIYQQSGEHPDTYIRNILAWYKKSGFVYTLSPGTLGENRIDDFLFGSRQGFCEHYASSFALLMRYVGIPARVVIGYQGGALAPDAQTWEVRQLDAHAWTEVQLNGQWQRFDPTAIIAPERIDQGMQDLMQNQPDLLGNQSTWQYQQFQMLKTLRVWSDYAGYQWQSKVVGYDVDKQKDWFAKLGLSSSYSAVLVMMLGIAGLLLLFLAFKLWQRYTALSEMQKILHRFAKKLPLSQHKAFSETFAQWMLRLSQDAKQPESFMQATKIYQDIMFRPNSKPEDLQKLQNLLKQCANELKS